MPKHYTQLEKDTIWAAAGLSNRPGRAVIVISYEATPQANGVTTIEHCIHAHAANDAPESVIRAIRDLNNIILDRIQKTSNIKH